MYEATNECSHTLHYRTAHGAYLAIKELDPGTAVTEAMIRTWILNGVIPTIKQGRKRLVAVEELQKVLANPEVVFNEKD